MVAILGRSGSGKSTLLGAFFLVAGVLHFVKPGAYASTVPDALPYERGACRCRAC